MIPLGSTARTRPLLHAGLCVLLLASITLFLHASGERLVEGDSTPAKSTWRTWFGLSANRGSSESIRVVQGYLEAYLAEQAAINLTYYHDTHGLNLDHSTHANYAKYLSDVARTYMSSSDAAASPWKRLVDARAAVHPPPDASAPPCPKQVITTDKTIDHLPKEFQRWKEIMPDWDTRYFDDRGLVDWVHTSFGGSRAEELWNALPRRVLQTDVFRYMIMLVEGGIYTDSMFRLLSDESSPDLADHVAAPVIRAEEWGRPYEDFTPSTLIHLSSLLSALDEAETSTDPGSSPEGAGREALEGRHSITAGEPSLVISIEADAIEFGWANWRGKHMARAVQITQWTFLARPGHPVFLDALGRTLRQAEEVQLRSKQASENGEVYTSPSALEWTGPGVFSDCVFTYLLARWATTPDDLVGHQDPIRIGDVLILPAGSFSSVNPFTDKEQRPWAAAWHGFLGRWRLGDAAEMASWPELSDNVQSR